MDFSLLPPGLLRPDITEVHPLHLSSGARPEASSVPLPTHPSLVSPSCLPTARMASGPPTRLCSFLALKPFHGSPCRGTPRLRCVAYTTQQDRAPPTPFPAGVPRAVAADSPEWPRFSEGTWLTRAQWPLHIQLPRVPFLPPLSAHLLFVLQMRARPPWIAPQLDKGGISCAPIQALSSPLLVIHPRCCH